MQQLIPIIKGNVYHIYNRGIDSCDIFNEKKNYPYFIERWIKYIAPVVDTYAYCLMKNHFHALVRIKPEDVYAERKEGGKYLLNPSRQFSHAFNSYTQGFNKEYKRTGTLFEQPFERKLVTSDKYFAELIAYIHLNPEKHKFESDFRNYEFSSYNSLLAQDCPLWINQKEVMDFFGSRKSFVEFHNGYRDYKNIHPFIADVDC